MTSNENNAYIDVAEMCELTHFTIPSDEVPKLEKELNKLLQYVQKINELDLRDVEPTIFVQPVENVFREDVNEPSLKRDIVFSNAPDTIGTEFKVPKIVE
ncbi:MAG: Asp-tRNA(Asn)/Glu-tRNA(Gln) amidotransferase subunit GatC [Lentisphaerae bacterium]|jgi:aspartyl-tRNA(Asn)/glutamyl-tRNA(Gln) amidotransferase subunit C|nr:Asp-tRNA(Asn)/Glu-tRNA(Gln) amidotransferase subunit GatC [Lentisphaerota bacterium]